MTVVPANHEPVIPELDARDPACCMRRRSRHGWIPGDKPRDDNVMAIIQSKIDTKSEAFQANRRDMLALVENFRALEQRVRDTSNQKLPMFQKRGQLTPRQRLAQVLDRGSPFLEISTLAGLNMHDDDGAENIQGGGVIAGIGYVSAACAA